MLSAAENAIARAVASMSTPLLRRASEDAVKLRDFAKALQHNDEAAIILLGIGIAAMEAEFRRRHPLPH